MVNDGTYALYSESGPYDMDHIIRIIWYDIKNFKGEMISPGNYNPPFEWKDGSGVRSTQPSIPDSLSNHSISWYIISKRRLDLIKVFIYPIGLQMNQT